MHNGENKPRNLSSADKNFRSYIDRQVDCLNRLSAGNLRGKMIRNAAEVGTISTMN
jgi:hypothetical protein